MRRVPRPDQVKCRSRAREEDERLWRGPRDISRTAGQTGPDRARDGSTTSDQKTPRRQPSGPSLVRWGMGDPAGTTRGPCKASSVPAVGDGDQGRLTVEGTAADGVDDWHPGLAYPGAGQGTG